MSGTARAGAQSRAPGTAIHTAVLTDIHLLSNVAPTVPHTRDTAQLIYAAEG